MHENQFINDVISKLGNSFGKEEIQRIMMTLEISAREYDISKKERAVAEYDGGYVPQCYKAYIVCLQIGGASEKTIKAYDHHLMQFFGWLRKPITQVTTNDIRLHLFEYQQLRKVSNRSLDNKRLVLRAFFSWLYKEEYIPENPCAAIGRIKFETKERKPMSGEEMYILKDSLTCLRDKAMLAVLYSTGCRVSELVALKREDVDFEHLEVHLFGKGAKHRTAYLNAEAKVALKRYLESRTDDNDALFVTLRKPYTSIKKEGIEARLRKLGKDAGIGRRVFPHLIRHTTATDALNRGMPVTELQAMLGHAKLDTTMIYAQVNSESIKHDHQKYVV